MNDSLFLNSPDNTEKKLNEVNENKSEYFFTNYFNSQADKDVISKSDTFKQFEKNDTINIIKNEEKDNFLLSPKVN